MNYETSAFRHFKNERAKLRNSMADLRFLAFKCCQHFGIMATKADALEVLEAYRSCGTGANELPDALNRISAWSEIISQAKPENAEGVFRQTGQLITKIYEQIRQ
jgi:hypothetical protein